MPVEGPTTSTAQLDNAIQALQRERNDQADPRGVSFVTHLNTGDDYTVMITKPGFGSMQLTTMPIYHDVLRGGRVRRWIGRRFFVEKRSVT